MNAVAAPSIILALVTATSVLAQATTPPATPPATTPPAAPPAAPPATPPADPVAPTSPPPTSPLQPNVRPGTVPTAPPAPATPGPGPTISGRPPEGAMRRYEPRLWDAKFEANVYLSPTVRGETAPIQLRSVVAWMPLIAQNTWSQTDPDSVRAELFVQSQPVRNINDRISWMNQLPFGMAAIGIAVGDVSGQSLRWNVSWRVKVWNTQINDAAAANIAWPQEWPADVRQALEPQPGIESDKPEFQQFVQKVSEGKLRQVTPFIAAKELVRATVQSFRTLDKVGLRQEAGFTRGLVLQGAYSAMQTGNGTSHDLVASCVAVLRAAGIPSRAVVGMSDSVTTSSGATKTRILTWAEFYLPDTGWIPFDPVELRSKGNSLPPPQRPWPNFGTWDDLNERVPLSFTWSAPAPGSNSLPYPAVWSWTASGYVINGVAQDAIGLQLLNRGRVRE